MLYLSVSTNPLSSTMTGTFFNGFIASNSGANCSPIQNIKMIGITTMGTFLHYFQNKNTPGRQRNTSLNWRCQLFAVNYYKLIYHDGHFIYNNIICSHWRFCGRREGISRSFEGFQGGSYPENTTVNGNIRFFLYFETRVGYTKFLMPKTMAQSEFDDRTRFRKLCRFYVKHLHSLERDSAPAIRHCRRCNANLSVNPRPSPRTGSRFFSWTRTKLGTAATLSCSKTSISPCPRSLRNSDKNTPRVVRTDVVPNRQSPKRPDDRIRQNWKLWKAAGLRENVDVDKR